MVYTDVTEGDRRGIFNVSNGRSVPSDDPLVTITRKYTKPAVIVATLVGALVYGSYVFKQTAIAGIESASGSFSAFHDDYESYINIKDELNKPGLSAEKKKDLEQREKDISAKVSAELAGLADVRDPYRSIGLVYSELFNSIKNDKPISASSNWKSLPQGLNRMLEEGKAFAGAKKQVDIDYKLGKGLLKGLAESGQYFNSVAAISLSRMADSEEEKADAIAILENLKTTIPNLTDIFNRELSRLKGE